MTTNPLEAFGLYLEDSYFLGMRVSGKTTRIHVLFALMGDHAEYAPPNHGEHHCYREGEIVISSPAVTKWFGGNATRSTDPDGSMDFGDIEVSAQAGQYRIVTGWFDLTCEGESVTIKLD